MSACASIADKHVGEGASNGSGGSAGASAANMGPPEPEAGGSRATGRTTVVPQSPQAGATGASEPSSGGVPASNAGGEAGERLELGGAPGDCAHEPVKASGGSPELPDCFEPLANGLRCEQAKAHAQGRYLERVCGATTLAECQAACRERPDCTGVSDYFAETSFDACYLRDAPCGTPGTGDWHEEDAGKEYVKVCPAGEPCHFEYLGDWIRCDEFPESVQLSTSLRDCVDTCLSDPTCVSVTDYFYLGRVPGCYLYTGSCDAPEPLPYGDTGQAYVRVACD